MRIASSAIDVLADVLKSIADLDPAFLPKLARRIRGRSRNHLAQPHRVYPKRPDLARTARPIAQGWYLGTNLADREKIRILKAACEVAGLDYGRDLTVGFGARADFLPAASSS